jgi:hypothetical protein
VRLPETACPRCESSQKFRPQTRSIGDNKVEVYIACSVCNYVSVLRVSTIEIERLRKMEYRWQAYGRAAQARHGVPSSLATAHLRKLRARIRELENEID